MFEIVVFLMIQKVTSKDFARLFLVFQILQFETLV
jgi:hypothetical protein